MADRVSEASVTLRPRGRELASVRVSVVVPTYKEAASLPALLDRLAVLRERELPQLDVLLMDDDSGDGTEALVAERGEPWVTLVVRKGERGLAAAVLDGFRRARGEVLVCMDADLSHPPERIPQMLLTLAAGFDLVVGSRYVPGGTTADDWGFLRWLNSRVATLLARPFTSILDPMSGFFALTKETFARGIDLNPVGYKIGLELIVKCRCQRVAEIPIHFAQREFGHSKLTLRQQLLYIRHLRRLAMFKYGVWSHLMQFLVVGLIGTAVNLSVLTGLLLLGVREDVAIALAIGVSMVSNFALNRRFSFSYARHQPWLRQFVGFVAASSFGAAINYLTATQMLRLNPGVLPQVAALAGIVAGTASNFVFSRFLVFKAKHVRH